MMDQQQNQDNDAEFQPNSDPRNADNRENEEMKDKKFFKTMKRVLELNTNKEYWDKYPEYKEEDISSEDSKSKNEKKEGSELAKSKERYEQFQEDDPEGKFIIPNESIHKTFIELFSGNVLQNNHIRYICLFIIIAGIIITIIFYQVLCLYKDACFKTNNSNISKHLSISIFPVYIIVALFFIFLYITIDYLHKPLMVVAIVLQIISTVLCIIFCIIGFIEYKKRTDDVKKLETILAAVFYLVIAIVQIVVLFISIYFKIMLSETANEWRPQLKTRINDIRAKRIIQIKYKYMKDRKSLYNAENKKEEKEVEMKDQTQIEGNNNSIANQPRPDSGYGYDRLNNLNNQDNNNNIINNEPQNPLPQIPENRNENQDGSENKNEEGGKLKRRRKK